MAGMNGFGMLTVLAVVLSVVVFLIVRASKNRAPAVDPSAKYNTLAILAFVFSFFVSVAAVVLGHIALSQIKRTNERGWGLAVAALVLGYLVIGFVVVLSVSFFTTFM